MVPVTSRGAGDLLTPDERAWLVKHGPLRYAPDPAFTPFEFVDEDGQVRGITPELLALLARNLDTRLEPVVLPTWEAVLAAIRRGDIDLIGTVTRTPEREQFLHFTRPYLEVPYVLFVPKDTLADTTIEDLYQSRLGVVKNYGALAWLQKEHPELPFIPVENPREGLLLLAVGQLDALLETLPVGAQIIDNLSLFKVSFLPEVLFTTPQHLAVSTSQPQLVSILQKGLNSLSDAERDEVMTRWTGFDQGRIRHAFPTWAGRALLILLLGLPILLIWIATLRRMVANRTQALQNSENRYRTLLENLPQMIFLKDVNSIYISCNERYARLLRIQPADIVGKTDFDFYPAELAEHYRGCDEQVRQTRAVMELDEELEVEGRRITIHTVKTPVYNHRGELQGVLGVFWDVTDRKRYEQARAELEIQLRQAQKMEAVGRLAGGVAHDFNNILTVILGNANLLAEEPGLNADTRSIVQDIVQAAGRAAGLTRQLLTFSRRQVVQVQPVQLNQVVERMRSILAPLIGDHIAVRIELAPEPPPVVADESMMEQVVLNLALNGRDAMPEGGDLVIRTAVEEIAPAPTLAESAHPPGRYVVLEVEDAGLGMDEETRSHLFEPFFTTKEVGKGTGLGLATVYGIVQQHHGWIDVTTQPDQGSRFRVYLPAAVQDDVPVAVERAAEGVVPRGTETVLVVEDEDTLRRMACAALQRLGYRVLEASDGQAALALWEQRRTDINLVLTDIVMPGGLSGLELAKRLRDQKSTLRIIYSSGYSDEVVFKRGDLPGDAIFLPKPYDVRTLAATVRRCLDR